MCPDVMTEHDPTPSSALTSLQSERERKKSGKRDHFDVTFILFKDSCIH